MLKTYRTWPLAVCAIALSSLSAAAATPYQGAPVITPQLSALLGDDRRAISNADGLQGPVDVFTAVPVSASIDAAPEDVRETDGDTAAELARLLGPDADALSPVRANRSFGFVPSRAGPRPEVVYSADFLAGLPAAKGDANWQCLTEALYFEARGESVRGLFAVAEVILNRVDASAFPGSVCRVVNQGTGRKYQCQFTFTCDGISDVVNEKRAWIRVGKVARLMLDGAPRVLTDGATHYHTKAVSPRWAKVFDLTATIGVHRFYRMG